MRHRTASSLCGFASTLLISCGSMPDPGAGAAGAMPVDGGAHAGGSPVVEGGRGGAGAADGQGILPGSDGGDDAMTATESSGAAAWDGVGGPRGPVYAFPEALGFGRAITGGRGGSVVHVTNLNDSGGGSFRDAVSASGRMIVFDVGGYVALSSAVSVKSNLTIAGQTAPGDGVGFMGNEVSFSGSSNIIVRYVRFRPGCTVCTPSDPDFKRSGINLAGSSAMIFDHVSIEFGQWNNMDSVGATDVTVQDSTHKPMGASCGDLRSSSGAGNGKSKVRPFPFHAEIEGMAGHVHAAAAEGDAFGLKPGALLQSRMSRQTDVSAGAQRAVPGDAAFGIVQRPGDLPGRARVARGARHIAVRRHTAFRNPAYGAAQLFQHRSYQFKANWRPGWRPAGRPLGQRSGAAKIS